MCVSLCVADSRQLMAALGIALSLLSPDTDCFPVTSCHMFLGIPTLQTAADSMYTSSPEPEPKWLCSLMHFMCHRGMVEFVCWVLLAALRGGFERRMYGAGLNLVTPPRAIAAMFRLPIQSYPRRHSSQGRSTNMETLSAKQMHKHTYRSCSSTSSTSSICQVTEVLRWMVLYVWDKAEM